MIGRRADHSKNYRSLIGNLCTDKGSVHLSIISFALGKLLVLRLNYWKSASFIGSPQLGQNFGIAFDISGS